MRFATALLALCLLTVHVSADVPTASVVHVNQTLPDGRIGSGTGTIIGTEDNTSLVLTCSHYPGGHTQPFSVTKDKADHKAELLVIDYDADVAILLVEKQWEACVVSTEPLSPGERLFIQGKASGKQTGQFVGYTPYTGPTIAASYISNNGDSGSGVFNDRHELVGVHTGRGIWGAEACHIGNVARVVGLQSRFPRLRARLERCGLGVTRPAPTIRYYPSMPCSNGMCYPTIRHPASR